MENNIDIKENYIYQIDEKLLEILLKDHSSNKNIIWATDNYKAKGKGYQEYDNISLSAITGRNGLIIKPRIEKSKKEQQIRVKDKAEVFTPSWICNKMANDLDNVWFEKENVFNTENDKTWTINNLKIEFSFVEGKTWQDYIKSNRMEISCGEAPYLVSRYDTTTGLWIDVKDRIGLLDRKLRVINENTKREDEWYKWTIEAFKSTFGFEWQGDSLLIARENLLFTFIDYYVDRFGIYPINDYLLEIAEIISWNIWQMNGLKFVIPNSCKPVPKLQMSFFEEFEKAEECPACKKGNSYKHTGIYSKIKNWKTNRTVIFNNIKGDKKMKFDFVIGNPPYQMEDNGNNSADSVERTSAVAVYPLFVTQSKSIADVVSLIIPSRWMTGGKGLDKFRLENLKDTHYKSIHDYEDDKQLFPNTDIGGGVMYFVWNNNYSGMVDYYFHNSKGVSKTKRFLDTGSKIVIRDYFSSLIVNKIGYADSFMNIVSARNSFSINGNIMKDESNFANAKSLEYNIKFYCWDGSPTVKFMKNNIISDNVLLNHYKVFISKTADPPIRFGRENKLILRKPFIGYPQEACSETYLTIGDYLNENEPQNIIKYIQSKFFRFLVLQKKKTQNVSRGVFEFVPIQNFTNTSDINWSKSISEIDEQLYNKYSLDDKERAFIESHVKEMD
ncbi:MAG: Eco57I restriction-modification methylase domain-containing protein [Clostridia bacterium]